MNAAFFNVHLSRLDTGAVKNRTALTLRSGRCQWAIRFVAWWPRLKTDTCIRLRLPLIFRHFCSPLPNIQLNAPHSNARGPACNAVAMIEMIILILLILIVFAIAVAISVAIKVIKACLPRLRSLAKVIDDIIRTSVALLILGTCAKVLMHWMFACLRSYPAKVTAVLILDLGIWVSQWSWICVRMTGVIVWVAVRGILYLLLGVALSVLRCSQVFLQIGVQDLARTYQSLTDVQNWVAFTLSVIDLGVWMTSSWRVHILAVLATIIGFRAWVLRAGHLDIISISTIAIGIQVYVFTLGHLDATTIAATFIGFKACVTSSPRQNRKLVITVLFGIGLYILHPEVLDFLPIARLMIGISAYIVSTNPSMERCDVQSTVQRSVYGSARRETGVLMRLAEHRVHENETQQRTSHQTLSAPSSTPNHPITTRARPCAVCGDIKLLSEYPRKTTRRCLHVPAICKEDLKSWISSQLNDTAWDQIRCPDLDCNETFQYEDIKANASDVSFARSVRLILCRNPQLA